MTASFGAEIAAVLAKEAFFDLDAPIERLAMRISPVPTILSCSTRYCPVSTIASRSSTCLKFAMSRIEDVLAPPNAEGTRATILRWCKASAIPSSHEPWWNSRPTKSRSRHRAGQRHWIEVLAVDAEVSPMKCSHD
jgi:hypothetical protein